MVEKQETSTQVTTSESKSQTLPKWGKIGYTKLIKIYERVSKRTKLSIPYIIFLAVIFTQSGCAPSFINLESQPTTPNSNSPGSKEERSQEIQGNPSKLEEYTEENTYNAPPTTEIESLEVNFGLDSSDFPVENNMTIDDSLRLLGETYKDKPKSHSYILCSLEKPSFSRFFYLEWSVCI